MQSNPDILFVDTKPIDRALERDLITTEGFSVDTAVVDSAADLANVGEGIPAFIVAADVPVTAHVFESLPALQVVGRAGIGVDNIALEAAEDAGVTVLNVPDYCIDEVSTHALSLLLACLRGVPMYDTDVRSGYWDWKEGQPIHRLSDQVVGVVGLGNIGHRFAKKVTALGTDVIAYDPYVEDDAFSMAGVTKVDFEELLDQATAVSIHCPLTSETETLFGKDEFARLDSGAVVINTARGSIVDQDALVDALTNNSIRAAGLDVFEDEPLNESPLQDLSNVILTPHVGWYSESAHTEVKKSVAEDVMRVLSGETPTNPVEADNPW